MSGTPGTPHFGDFKDVQKKDRVILQSGDGDDADIHTKIHFNFDNAQRSRAMGSTLGDAPGCGWERHDRQVDYMCNHDGYSGGNVHNLNMDEQKVLQNRIYSVECCYADDFQKNYGSDERTA